jgi:hypothetical protein
MTSWLLPLLVACLQGAAPSHTHGNMSGEITATTAVVWTRADRAALATLFVSTQPDLAGAVAFGPVPTAGSHAAQLLATGLMPGTRHWFRTRLTDPLNASSWEDGPVGSFRTAPMAATPFTFAASGDALLSSAYPVFAAMRSLQPHFYLSLGDWPYCDPAVTEDEYRAQHQLNRAALDQVLFTRDVPVFATLDDHEVGNDWDSRYPPARVAAGRRVWQEWFPIVPAAPGVLYRSHAWGPAVRIYLLDCRSHRGSNVDPDLPGRPMLGAAQLNWLQQQLLAATETFHLILSSVPLRHGGTRDDWEGYQRERRQLFEFLQLHRIHNVVFLSADKHMGKIQHHPEGWVEVVVGPITAAPRAAQEHPEPPVRAQVPTYGFGLVRVDPTQSPPVMTIELRDMANNLRATQQIVARAAASLQLSAGGGRARLALSGPRFLLEQGGGVTLPTVAPGAHRLTAAAADGLPVPFPEVTVDIPEGGTAGVGVLPRVTAATRDNLLFSEDFAGPGAGLPLGFTAVDEGTLGAPSAWFVDGGQLWQSSNIATTVRPRPGTHVVCGNPSWTDQVVRVRFRSRDDDVVCVLFRYQDPDHYYLATLDRERGLRTLWRNQGGVFTTLASQVAGYELHRFHEVECRALGSQLMVLVDGVPALTATDGTFAAGRVGLGTLSNDLAAFDQLRVFRAVPAEGVVFEDHFESSGLVGWSVVDEGTVSAPSAWQELGGVAQQTSNISGPGAHRPGTSLLRVTPTVADGVWSARVRNADDDGIGLLFRVQGNDTFYRFQMDAQQRFLRLEKVVGGVHTVLAQDLARGYDPLRWYHVEVAAMGPQLSVRLDGEQVLAAVDAALASGGVGLYCFSSTGVAFDEVKVRAFAASDAPVTTVTSSDGRRFTVTAWVRGAAGHPALLLYSGTAAPGIDLSAIDPEQRVLPLGADALFDLSLRAPSATRFDATDRAALTLALPADPALAGLRLVLGGVRITPSLAVTPMASVPVVVR